MAEQGGQGTRNGADEMWAEACSTMKKKAFDEAHAWFVRFAQRWPDDPRAEEADYRALEARFGEDRCETHPGAAIAAFVRRHPGSLWAARALYLGARAGNRLGRPWWKRSAWAKTSAWRDRLLTEALATWERALAGREPTAAEADEFARMALRQAAYRALPGSPRRSEAGDSRELLRQVLASKARPELRQEAAAELRRAAARESRWGESAEQRVSAREELTDLCREVLTSKPGTPDSGWAAADLVEALTAAERHDEPTEALRLALPACDAAPMRDDIWRRWQQFVEPNVSWQPPGVVSPGEASQLSLSVRNTNRVELELWQVDHEQFWPARLQRAWDWEQARAKARRVSRWCLPVPEVGPYERQRVAVELPALPAGLYHVLAWPQEKPRAAVAHALNVGHLGLLAHVSRAGLAVHAVDRRTGQAWAGCEVVATVIPPGGGHRQRLEGVTNKSGLWWTPLPVDEDAPYGWELDLAARSGDELGSTRRLMLGSGDPRPPHGQLCCDRPVYRAGEDVRFRLVLLHRGPDGWAPLAGATVTCHAQGRLRDEHYCLPSATTDANGVVTGVWRIPRRAGLGPYVLEAQADGRTVVLSGWRHFLVATDRTSAVNLKLGDIRHRSGGWLEARVEATDPGGHPMAGAAVQWASTRSPWYWKPRLERPAFWEQPKRHSRECASAGEVMTTAAGQALIRTRTNLRTTGWRADFGVPDPDGWTYRLAVGLTDASGALLTTSSATTLSARRLFLELMPSRSLVSPGEMFAVALFAERANSQPACPPVTVELWRLAPGSLRRDPRTGEMVAAPLAPTDCVWRRLVALDEHGAATLVIEAPDEGPWELRARVARHDGGPAVAVARIWSVAGETVPLAPPWADLALISESAIAEVGRPLRLLVASPVPNADLLICVFAESLLEQRIERLAGPTSVIALDVPLAWAPGVALVAAVTGPNAVYEARLDLPVAAPSKRLQVDLEVEAPHQGVGRVTVMVRDRFGAPVSAAVCLRLVDQDSALLAASDAGPPTGVFHGRLKPPYCGLTASFPWTHDTFGEPRGSGERISAIRSERCPEPPRPHAHVQWTWLPEPAALIAGQADDCPVPVAVPPFHAPPLIWEPLLQTDTQGHASVSVTYPNATTTWLVTAEVVTADGGTGEASTTVTAS